MRQQNKLPLGDVYGDDNPILEVDVIVVSSDNHEDDGVAVMTGGTNLVIVENCGGKLVCHVWANRGAEDPTHSIEIELAPYSGPNA